MSNKLRNLVPFAAVTAIGLLSMPTHAVKAQLSRCSAGQFETEKSDNKVFVAWFPASWCPTCKRQKAALEELVDGRLEGNPRICSFDFDSSGALLKQLGGKSQSTMIRFERGSETARLVGESTTDRLRQFLEGR